MATAETHRCNNCKIPLEYRTLLRLTCHHEFCTFCFDIQGHNVKQPCQLCYKITVPKHADREHLRQVEESDELQPSSLRPTTVYASKAEFPYVFLAETRMQNENMIEHAIKTIVDAIKNNPGEQVQHENKSFPVRKEFGQTYGGIWDCQYFSTSASLLSDSEYRRISLYPGKNYLKLRVGP